MSSRGTTLKLSLVALPFLAGVLSLHALGEPAGRAARAASAAFSYPEHVHGLWRIRDRRGSAYHSIAARKLDEFAQPLSAWAAPLEVVLPTSLQVYLLDTREDLEHFGIDPRRLEGDGMADPAAGVLAIVSEGNTRNQEQDARALRHWLTRFLLGPPLERAHAGAWAEMGLAACFETAVPGSPAPAPPPRPEGVPLPLSTILEATAADYRGMSRARLIEGARLWVSFLLEKKPAALAQWLRGEPPGSPDRWTACFGDLQDAERQWSQWLGRPPK
jgi:hypothetical protein